MPDFDFSTPATLVRDITDLAYFHPCEDLDGEVAIPFLFDPGDDASRVLLVLGDNASGKSFFRRIVQSVSLDDADIRECIHLSMEGRTGGLSNIARAMVYGNERRDSTGCNTSRTVTTGINTSKGREHDHVMIWDEPDLGLSENAAAGVGQVLGEFAASLNDHVKLVLITTHSRALIQAFLTTGPRPHYLFLGNSGGPATLDAWFARPVVPVLPKDVQEMNRRRCRMIQKILDRK